MGGIVDAPAQAVTVQQGSRCELASIRMQSETQAAAASCALMCWAQVALLGLRQGLHVPHCLSTRASLP